MSRSVREYLMSRGVNPLAKLLDLADEVEGQNEWSDIPEVAVDMQKLRLSIWKEVNRSVQVEQHQEFLIRKELMKIEAKTDSQGGGEGNKVFFVPRYEERLLEDGSRVMVPVKIEVANDQ